MKKPLFLLLFVFLCLQSCQLGRTLIYNFADIKDYKKFPSREIQTDSSKFIFSQAKNGKVPKFFTSIDSVKIPFDEFLSKNKTVAFLIIQDDSIHYEKYFKSYSRESIVPSFSMAKSVLSILIGMAIEDGYVSSVKDPVTNYIPDMKAEAFADIRIEHLLQMTSGIKFNESYLNPFGDAAAFYYGRNLIKKTKNLKVKNPPGTVFEYTSGSSQLLGLVLHNALPEDISISEYLETKIWKPLGMHYNATWSIDQEGGIEKTFCCLNARAIDFAKIGRLYLEEGNWNNRQLVKKSWVKKSIAIDSTYASPGFYQYQWWLPTPNGDFAAKGILGQFIYVNPNKNLIIVRLGKNHGDVDWMEVFISLAKAY